MTGAREQDLSKKPTSAGGRQRSRRSKRQRGVRSSEKRLFKQLVALALYTLTALCCLWVGYYYLGPKLTNMGE